MALKIPKSLQNWASLTGLMIAAISFFMILLLFGVTAIIEGGGIYLGLVTYILLPAVMSAGLIIAVIGFIVRSSILSLMLWCLCSILSTFFII